MLALASSGPWMPRVLLSLPHPSFKASLSHDCPLLSPDVRHVHAQRWTQDRSLQKCVSADTRMRRGLKFHQFQALSPRPVFSVLACVTVASVSSWRRSCVDNVHRRGRPCEHLCHQLLIDSVSH